MSDASRRIKAHAAALGFDLCGIAPAGPSAYRQYLLDWIASGQAGDMHYLQERFAERTDPNLYLPGVRTIVCVAINYHVPLAPVPPGHGRIARYAQGDDYHDRLKKRLYDLADWIRAEFPDAQTRCGTDSVPVLEREYAARAGIGWVGKNTCVLHPVVGSWLLLGEVLTTLDLPADEPMADHCGTCTRCIDACPTDAITAPYQLDARRCISYLTIEHAGDIDPDLAAKTGDWLYGCDICQDVCPHNHRAPTATTPWLQPRVPTNSVDPAAVLNWSTDDYHRFTRHTAMRRVKLPQLQRNARMVLRNQEKE
ncbi:MAG TPA: tRNA epoxyqueuosine(34) reductase QueG [Tepidisphaeraceae bacterium]